jgi:hypothetical protein
MGKGGGLGTCCDILIAILLPPLGVFFKYGCRVSNLQILATYAAPINRYESQNFMKKLALAVRLILKELVKIS